MMTDELRDLDRRVAEALGLPVSNCRGTFISLPGGDECRCNGCGEVRPWNDQNMVAAKGRHRAVPHSYSTKIADAWTLVEWMRERGWRLVIDETEYGWRASFGKDGWQHVGTGRSIAGAISRAVVVHADYEALAAQEGK